MWTHLKKKKSSNKTVINTEATLDENKSQASAKPIEEVQEKSIYKRFIKWLNT